MEKEEVRHMISPRFQAPMSQRPNAKRRLLTYAEIEEARLGKVKRICQCGGCQEYARHNISTCPKRKKNLCQWPDERILCEVPSSTSEQVRQRQHQTIRSLRHQHYIPQQQQQRI